MTTLFVFFCRVTSKSTTLLNFQSIFKNLRKEGRKEGRNKGSRIIGENRYSIVAWLKAKSTKLTNLFALNRVILCQLCSRRKESNLLDVINWHQTQWKNLFSFWEAFNCNPSLQPPFYEVYQIQALHWVLHLPATPFWFQVYCEWAVNCWWHHWKSKSWRQRLSGCSVKGVLLDTFGQRARYISVVVVVVFSLVI